MQDQDPQKLPKTMNVRKNPFVAGFRGAQPPPEEKRVYDGRNRWTRSKSLLKLMLEVPLRATDMPTHIADAIRLKFPGLIDDVDRKITMWQVLEMTQFQLLFSSSDYVRQAAVEAIKNRVEGRPMQKLQVETLESEPTEFLLPGGRVITI